MVPALPAYSVPSNIVEGSLSAEGSPEDTLHAPRDVTHTMVHLHNAFMPVVSSSVVQPACRQLPVQTTSQQAQPQYVSTPGAAIPTTVPVLATRTSPAPQAVPVSQPMGVPPVAVGSTAPLAGLLETPTPVAQPLQPQAVTEAASRKLSVPDPPPLSAVPAAVTLARPASCHQLSTILAGSVGGGAVAKDELAGQCSAHDLETYPAQGQHGVVSSQLYDDLRGDSASALDSASEASDLTDSSASARERARKKVNKRRRAQAERWPRLLVLSVEGGTVVECQLESSKGKTVTFKFDIHDMFPRDIANNLVVTNLLAEQHADVFVEQVQDIVQQLKEHPDRLPTVCNPLAAADGRLSFENMENSTVLVTAGRLEKESSEPPGSCQGSPVRQVKPLPAAQLHQAGIAHLASSPIEEQAPPMPATFLPVAAAVSSPALQQHVTAGTVAATVTQGPMPPVPVAMVVPPTPVTKAVPAQAAAVAVSGTAAAAQGEVRLPAQQNAPDASTTSQAATPPAHGATPHALSSENSFSESDPGSSTLPQQAYALVTDLSHLQQRLVELTTPSSAATAHPPAVSVAASLPSDVAVSAALPVTATTLL
ncbi:hypothetical protein V5799_004437, partial [Amblyomma americanum]